MPSLLCFGLAFTEKIYDFIELGFLRLAGIGQGLVLAFGLFNNPLAFRDLFLQIGNAPFGGGSQFHQLIAACLTKILQRGLLAGGIGDDGFRRAADGAAQCRQSDIDNLLAGVLRDGFPPCLNVFQSLGDIDNLLAGVLRDPGGHVAEHVQRLFRRERNRRDACLLIKGIKID